MALRVLLADESTTIKKVMQLTLQDYAVEVKSVPSGIDVLPVARTFKPDIVFIDVLLPKRSGYDVAKDFKNDPQLGSTPLVLMWSGFMEFDEQKARESRADQRLEKPFDADHLRSIIKTLVSRTQTNTISDYLNFPPLPEFEEESLPEIAPEAHGSSSAYGGEVPLHAAPTEVRQNTGEFSKSQNIYEIPEVDEDEQFETVPLNLQSTAPRADESWSHKDLSTFMIPTDELNAAQIQSDGEFEEVTFVNKQKPQSSAPAAAPKGSPAYTPSAGMPMSAADEARAESILREESRAVLEKVAWQILPEICERIVKDELNRLLKTVEKSI